MTRIISAFPGTGKTYLFTHPPAGKVILDSDSSKFSWARRGVRNPKFPTNYIEHIHDHLGKADYILVSSHRDVRDMLHKVGMPYIAVFPSLGLMHEYLRRFTLRGSDPGFVALLGQNWTGWIQDMSRDCQHGIVLGAGEYLSDVVRMLEGSEP